MRDSERVSRICAALQHEKLDALVCALPAYVLMNTGYWPVIGTSICITTADGRQIVVAPEDEEELAKRGWAEVHTYKVSSLEKIETVSEAVAGPLHEAVRSAGIIRGRIGFERGPASEPASYVGMNLFKGSMITIIHEAIQNATLVPADHVLERLAAIKTPSEVEKIRRSCGIARDAFEGGSMLLCPGMSEAGAAARFRAPLSVLGVERNDIARADGFAFCMSGPNSAEAYGAYARSRSRKIQEGDLALIHCNSYADGYWTDITRTYSIGEPDDRKLEIYEAVFAARNAALKVTRPGIRASDLDYAARDKLARRGFGKEFKHSTGHGVGFAAISANARPRIHPKSEEILEAGMVFNVEPAIYIEGFGGIRHCDMVVVTNTGVEVLTPFHSLPEELILTEERLAERRRDAA